MTVRELIKLLKECDDQDALVVMSSDAEGNRFDTVKAVQEGLYRLEWKELIHPDDAKEMDEFDKLSNVMVIWP